MFSDRRIRTSLVAIAADILLTLIKLITAWFTGSAALLADAYHSLTDILVSVTLLSGLVTRYCVEKGHLSISEEKAHKLEATLAVLMALLILYVPVEIIQEISTQEAEELKHLWVGIVGILLCIFIAWFMSRLKNWVGKETDSLALVADGYHSQLDVFSSIAVLLSLIGTMIGIYLDEIVAVIIAVMVAIAGLELLVSGIKSLMSGDELRQISITEKLMESSAAQQSKITFKHLRKPSNIALLSVILTSTYVGSGFRIIPHGYIGYTQFLYHRNPTPLEPGLHYAAPWPFGGLITLSSLSVSSINTMQTRIDANEKGKSQVEGIDQRAASGLWHKTFSATAKQAPGNALLLTLDENMVDITVSLHFSVLPQDQLLMDQLVQQDILTQFTESALIFLAAEKHYNALFHGPKKHLETRLNELIRNDLESAGIRLNYIQSFVQSIKSPPPVVESHWQQFNEYQTLLKAKLNADSQRQEDLARANAKSLSDINAARAKQVEQVELVLGDLNRYLPMQTLYHDRAELLEYNSRLNNLRQQFKDKQITIIDPRLSEKQIRLWHPNETDSNQSVLTR